jgi:hypothetical protein
MSTTTKKTSTKGVRYTDAQKKEVIDFAVNYNAANGRGGQSKAAEKYKISQLTVATWLKGAGAAAPKSAKVVKAPKVAKAPKVKKSGKTRLGSRYTPEQKKEVTDFVASYNAANGRGGASNASKKFKVSPLTVIAWLKATGVKDVAKKSTKAPKAAKAPKAPQAAVAAASGGLSAKLNSLLALSHEIEKAEAGLAQLKAKFSSLKASL